MFRHRSDTYAHATVDARRTVFYYTGHQLCVCVCVRERERERAAGLEKG
jgi:hypothetical protein